MKNYGMEVDFCKKTLRSYLVEGRYEDAADTINLLKAKNPNQAKTIFVKECNAIMNKMFDGSPNPRKAIDFVGGVRPHIPKDWYQKIMATYQEHMTNMLIDPKKIFDEQEGN
ncbi:MAG TPA: hypothetical protein PKM85_01310 [Candidatus Pacearchaeota archaeon]|nr:hypothetical protein [Candidatus Pacearchaeota archaeon]